MAAGEKVAICPGSYDPVTNGHLDIISRTSKVFDRVVVGVVNQPVRKQKTLYTAEERKAFIEAYQKAYNVDRIPSPVSAAQGYDSIYLLAAAIKQAGVVLSQPVVNTTPSSG